MAIGLLGKKLGMTHVYDEYGRRIAVSAIVAGPCTILRTRKIARDGYNAVQLGFEEIKESRLNKPLAGQFKKIGMGPFRYVREFRMDGARESNGDKATEAAKLEVGQKLSVDLFKEFELVDITGISIRKNISIYSIPNIKNIFRR